MDFSKGFSSKIVSWEYTCNKCKWWHQQIHKLTRTLAMKHMKIHEKRKLEFYLPNRLLSWLISAVIGSQEEPIINTTSCNDQSWLKIKQKQAGLFPSFLNSLIFQQLIDECCGGKYLQRRVELWFVHFIDETDTLTWDGHNPLNESFLKVDRVSHWKYFLNIFQTRRIIKRWRNKCIG